MSYKVAYIDQRDDYEFDEQRQSVGNAEFRLRRLRSLRLSRFLRSLRLLSSAFARKLRRDKPAQWLPKPATGQFTQKGCVELSG